MSDRLGRLGISFDRLPGVVARHRHGTERLAQRGCMLAHWAAIRWVGLQREPVLVLEDDAVLRDDIVDWLPIILSQLGLIGWDLCYLDAWLSHSLVRSVGQNLEWFSFGILQHARIVNPLSAGKLCRLFARYEAQHMKAVSHSDVWLAMQEEVIKVRTIPTLAIQEPGWSDIEGRVIDRYASYPAQVAEFAKHCRELSDTDFGRCEMTTDMCVAASRPTSVRS